MGVRCPYGPCCLFSPTWGGVSILVEVSVYIIRSLRLLVKTPSAIRPELASRWAEHCLPYSDVTIYIFAI